MVSVQELLTEEEQKETCSEPESLTREDSSFGQVEGRGLLVPASSSSSSISEFPHFLGFVDTSLPDTVLH